MGFPFRKILCAIDFADSAPSVLGLAARLAVQNDGTVYVLHAFPVVLASPPWDGQIYGLELYKDQEEGTRARLRELARRHLSGIKYELMIRAGEPVTTIIKAQRQIPADLAMIATRGRRGFARVFLGSVAEEVTP